MRLQGGIRMSYLTWILTIVAIGLFSAYIVLFTLNKGLVVFNRALSHINKKLRKKVQEYK
jgi:hypothetical protein